MKIPYGMSNFRDIRTNGYFYVDKTPFLPQIEQLGAATDRDAAWATASG